MNFFTDHKAWILAFLILGCAKFVFDIADTIAWWNKESK